MNERRRPYKKDRARPLQDPGPGPPRDHQQRRHRRNDRRPETGRRRRDKGDLRTRSHIPFWTYQGEGLEGALGAGGRVTTVTDEDLKRYKQKQRLGDEGIHTVSPYQQTVTHECARRGSAQWPFSEI